MTNPKQEPILDLARGDIGMSRHLRSALNVLAGSGLARGMEKQLREIAQGNGSLRDLRHNEAFLRLSDSLIAQAKRDRDNQAPEEEQQLVDEGHAILEDHRQHDPNPPEPTRPPSTTNPPAFAASSAPPSHPNHSSAPHHLGTPSDATPTSHPATPSNTIPTPTRRQSWRDVVVTPDEPDEDDVYFQERRRRGWLQ